MYAAHLNAKAPPIDVIPQEKIRIIVHCATDLEQLHEIIILPVDVPAYWRRGSCQPHLVNVMDGTKHTCNRSSDINHVRLTRKDLSRLLDDEERLLLSQPALPEKVIA